MNKTKEITLKVIKITTNVLFALVLVLALGVTFMSLGSSSKNEVPSIFGYSPLAVRSESMEPTIKKGDLIFVKRNTSTFEEDDIITFHAVIEGEKTLNTHRITEVVEATGQIEENYVTKGDNNPVDDEVLVMKSEVIGKYNGFKLPVLGYVVNFASGSTGFFVLIVLPLLAYFIYHVVRVVMAAVDYKKEKEEGEKV